MQEIDFKRIQRFSTKGAVPRSFNGERTFCSTNVPTGYPYTKKNEVQPHFTPQTKCTQN